ncbi:hypothetical protein AB0B25_09960 [Nocardia sp. NPDC049190]|uniref:hypothetical protein n=1 Tax=Nocardia sp. NPDC049190 TaxID=3155650 RepID=UPI0033C0FC76
MTSNDLRSEIESRLGPWQQTLGRDRAAYTNHVLRVLTLCDLLAPDQQPPPSRREEYLTAATLHDIGIWSAGTFDYLAPSCDHARAWLASIDRSDLTDVVVPMINEHHKIRAAGAPDDAVETSAAPMRSTSNSACSAGSAYPAPPTVTWRNVIRTTASTGRWCDWSLDGCAPTPRHRFRC